MGDTTHMQTQTHSHFQILVAENRRKTEKVSNENSMHLSISKFHLFAHCLAVCVFLFWTLFTHVHM